MTARPVSSVAPGSGPEADPYAGIPARPVVRLVLREDGSGTVNGQVVTIPPGADRHLVLMTRACRIAATLGHPVRVTACDAATEWELIAEPDGGVIPVGDGRPMAPVASGSPAASGSRENSSVRADDRPPRSKPPQVDLPPDLSPDPPVAHPAAAATPPRVSPASTGGEVVPEGWATVNSAGPGLLGRPQRLGSAAWATRSGSTRATSAGAASAGAAPAGAASAGAASAGAASGGAGPTRRRSPRTAANPGAVVWSSRRRRDLRSLSFPLLGGVAAGGLLLAALAVGLQDREPTAKPVVTTVTASGASSPGPAARSSGPSTSGTAPTTLEAVGPVAFAAKPAWAVPIAAWTKSVAADGGTVLTRDPDGRLLLLDPATGGTRWRSSLATRRSQKGPWLTQVDGHPVAALVGDGLLSYWPLPASATATAPTVEEAGVSLPAGAKVTWIGSAPLVTSSGGAGVIRSGKYTAVPLASHARPLAADGSTVLAVSGASFVRQRVGRPAARLRALPRPKGVKTRPVRVEAVGTDLLLTVWARTSRRGQIAALVDTTTGALVVQTELEGGLDLTRARVVRETAGTQMLLGSVLVDTYTNKLNLLDPRYTVRGVTRGHAWALLNGRATDIHLNRTGDFRPEPFASGEPALPIGVVAAAGARPETAVVVAPRGDGWVLAGLRASS